MQTFIGIIAIICLFVGISSKVNPNNVLTKAESKRNSKIALVAFLVFGLLYLFIAFVESSIDETETTNNEQQTQTETIAPKHQPVFTWHDISTAISFKSELLSTQDASTGIRSRQLNKYFTRALPSQKQIAKKTIELAKKIQREQRVQIAIVQMYYVNRSGENVLIGEASYSPDGKDWQGEKQGSRTVVDIPTAPINTAQLEQGFVQLSKHSVL